MVRLAATDRANRATGAAAARLALRQLPLVMNIKQFCRNTKNYPGIITSQRFIIDQAWQAQSSHKYHAVPVWARPDIYTNSKCKEMEMATNGGKQIKIRLNRYIF